MSDIVSYNDIVRAYFADPAHAGDLPANQVSVATVEVAESAHGARVQLSAGFDRETITALAYRVHGCPHLLAALEHFCTLFAGAPVSRLEKPDFADITRELAIPVEKSGRILLLEDAVAALWSHCAGPEH